ncbi:hypothetical protein TNCT_425631 [Trichonephila clavata]|uniref:Uncharacterized protein n=1 Tax=Trichonephila clavata TaxID=2740835 RepID=A0A8X6K862_TRICU|nr:hypothetical protein TNCT_425631 [Trichonephila clavata]
MEGLVPFNLLKPKTSSIGDKSIETYGADKFRKQKKNVIKHCLTGIVVETENSGMGSELAAGILKRDDGKPDNIKYNLLTNIKDNLTSYAISFSHHSIRTFRLVT